MPRAKAPQTTASTEQLADGPLPLQLHPPTWLRLLRWGVFCCTVAIAIGMLALLDQHLTSIPWLYDGQLAQYQGRPIRIQYCLLSPTADYEAKQNCQFAFAVPSVSLALSLLWSYLQVLRRNPFKHPAARLVDLVLCVVWLLLWGVTAVVLCIWADQANKAGSFLAPGRDWRNGLCVMAWVEFLLVAILVGAAGLLAATKNQAIFDRWEEKSKQKKAKKEADRLRHLQQQKQQQDAAAAAAAATVSAAPKPLSSAAASGALKPLSPAAASGAAQVPPPMLPQSTGAGKATGPAVAATGSGGGGAAAAEGRPAVPAVSGANPSSAAIPSSKPAGAVVGPATSPPEAAGDYNPFRSDAAHQPGPDNV